MAQHSPAVDRCKGGRLHIDACIALVTYSPCETGFALYGELLAHFGMRIYRRLAPRLHKNAIDLLGFFCIVERATRYFFPLSHVADLSFGLRARHLRRCLERATTYGTSPGLLRNNCGRIITLLVRYIALLLRCQVIPETTHHRLRLYQTYYDPIWQLIHHAVCFQPSASNAEGLINVVPLLAFLQI